MVWLISLDLPMIGSAITWKILRDTADKAGEFDQSPISI